MKEEACPSCTIKLGSVVTIRAKRSNYAKDHDGEVRVLFEHRISSVEQGDLFDGKHLSVLDNPFINAVVWGDEIERVQP